ncbi:MAG: Signal transduction histidine kinase/Ligand-binding sensor domain-containing protein [Candidatus Methanomarinus sp.]|nr:MAG: Signal transduction histidine kinase/Ligand-binding sensor domain-containing protein [ANME-2 cluster archaeon]
MNNSSLPDLIDLDELQAIRDKFARTVGLSSVIFSPEGEPLTHFTDPTGYCSLIQSTEKGKRRCNRSFIEMGKKALELKKPQIFYCFAYGGHFVAPIIINDEHKGTMFAGQFIPQNFSTVQLEGIEEIASNINVDPVQLINEAKHMRVVDKDLIRNNASLLFMIVNFITRLGMKAAELKQTGDALQKTRDELEIIVQDRTVELMKSNEELKQEIIDRKNIEKTLKNSEKKFFTMFNNNPMGAIIIDSNRMIKEVNSVASDMIGRSKAEIIGKICHEFVCPRAHNDCPIFDHEMGFDCVETTLLKKDYGEIPIEKTVAKVVIDEKIMVIEMFYDISKRQQLQKDLINQRDTLKIRAQELTAANKTKTEFLANMSHELRTPLNSIIGFSEILHDLTFGPLNEKQLKYISNVLTSGNHLLTLINDILDLSKVEAGKMELVYNEFVVSTVINEIKTLVISIASKKNIMINVITYEKLITIHADGGKFKQILFNLMSNAIKFSPNGGSVTIDAKCINDMVQIAITDTGIGISKEDQKKLFQPFVQVDASTSRQFEGTGLGLALVKRFVGLHGGKVWIESEPGKGSTFTFTIPIQPETGVKENIPTLI